ncbi:MAG: hypothetical protein VX438_17380 [Planctomycetota bacterium]|nr:hypothetical protein [Planctomycetota bacterium]
MNTRTFRLTVLLGIATVCFNGFAYSNNSSHCPFCTPVAPTFAEEMKSTDAVLIGKLVKRGKREVTSKKIADELGFKSTVPSAVGKSELEVLKVIKGNKYLKVGDTIQAYVFGDAAKGDQFFITGVEPPAFSWSTMKASKRVVDYISGIQKLPADGPKRLAFFLSHLEDDEEVLARDSYDEFALAPFAAVKQLKELIDRKKLRKWIEDKDIPASRKGLYFTLLGIAGNESDADFLKALMGSGDDRKKAALDSMIACFITLKGPAGLKTVEKLFLANKQASYSDAFAAIAALRFHGSETQVLKKTQIVASLRYMLDREDLADLVIPDLARWEDWSVLEKLVQLFKEADPETSWVRMPVVNYLRACPLPKAKKYMSDLEKLDPKTFKRARAFFPEYDLDDIEEGAGEQESGGAEKSTDKTPADSQKGNPKSKT